jgi:carboxyl-terminal processing protease
MRTIRRLVHAAAVVAACSLFAPAVRPVEAQVSGEMRDRGLKMLEQLRKDLRQYYYDSTFNGVDMEAAYQKAENGVRNAPDNNRLMGALADYLLTLQDSHTWFAPPAKVAEVDYGFATTFEGDTAFVVSVTKGTDAEAKGLKRGDAILKWDAFRPERRSWWLIEYVYYALSPRPGLQLVVRSPGDTAGRELVIRSKITEGLRVIDPDDPGTMRRLIDEYERAEREVWHRYASVGGDSVLVWRMASFVFGDEENVDRMLKLAKKHRALIFDLRDNGGGSVDIEKYIVSKFFDRDITIYSRRERGKLSPLVAKPTDKDPYRGMLVILVNANSGSASEITARIMQFEGRALIVGDRTAGKVVTSRFYSHDVGFGRVISYGASVSVADVIMPDGKRLENIGVMPDHVVVRTGADIAARRDPQMAKALELVGVTRTPEQAARLFGGGDKDKKN